jgi:hypothetical protein
MKRSVGSARDPRVARTAAGAVLAVVTAADSAVVTIGAHDEAALAGVIRRAGPAEIASLGRYVRKLARCAMKPAPCGKMLDRCEKTPARFAMLGPPPTAMATIDRHAMTTDHHVSSPARIVTARLAHRARATAVRSVRRRDAPSVRVTARGAQALSAVVRSAVPGGRNQGETEPHRVRVRFLPRHPPGLAPETWSGSTPGGRGSV